jgi:hypothetical protein
VVSEYNFFFLRTNRERQCSEIVCVCVCVCVSECAYKVFLCKLVLGTFAPKSCKLGPVCVCVCLSVSNSRTSERILIKFYIGELICRHIAVFLKSDNNNGYFT